MTTKRRVAILTQTYPPTSGGIAAAHFNLTSCLQKKHEVRVFAFDDSSPGTETHIEKFKTSRWMGSCMRFLARLWIRKYASGQDATNCEHIFAVMPAIQRINRSLLRFRPDFILCPDNYVPALALKKPPGSQLLWIAHHNFRRFEANPLVTTSSWIDLQLAHRLERRAVQKADAVVAVSDYIAKVSVETLAPKCRVSVIRNYVDTVHMDGVKPSNLRQKMGITDQRPIVYLPSAGRPVKGERFAYEIIRRLGNGGRAAFFISGAICQSLRFELDHLGQDTIVHTPGRQSYSDNLRDMAACDFTVSPTLIENLSSALIESLACGLPVVSFDVGGNAELIQPDRNGFLVPYLDMEQLITAAMSLIDDRGLLAQMRSRARASIASLLDPDRVLQEYDAVFQSCTGGTPA